MSVLIPYGGTSRSLNSRAAPDETPTERDVQDPSKLARLLVQLLKAVADLRRAWMPRKIYFQDWPVTTTADGLIRLEHRFGGRVHWWVCDWLPATPGYTPVIERDATSDDDALVLKTNMAVTATASFCVEETG